MSETERVTLVGNLTADPELRYTPTGLEVANLRLAVTPRTRQEDGSWTQGETSFHTVIVWRDQATNTAETLTKGARVIWSAAPSSAAGPTRTAPSTRSPRWTPRRSVPRCAGPPPRSPAPTAARPAASSRT